MFFVKSLGSSERNQTDGVKQVGQIVVDSRDTERLSDLQNIGHRPDAAPFQKETNMFIRDAIPVIPVEGANISVDDAISNIWG